MKIVGRIGQVETDNGDRPVDDVKIGELIDNSSFYQALKIYMHSCTSFILVKANIID